MTPPDPETERIDWLLAQVRRGAAQTAEIEELSIYAADDGDVRQRLERALQERRLGEGWLERVEQDQLVKRIENSPVVKIEQLSGLTLIFGGAALNWFAPPWGAAAIGLGTLLLLFSFVRARLRAHRRDPYNDVSQ